ncbi:DUF4333 domain-containing protein [Streptomyces sp. YC504]|uniref:DUF4333 domain-containing protein n=1 Tax=Streptomyces mesophilus TaxID=1775132 RepID=A0A6G4XHI2_9ACTN|nr:DUF4333 domain-containing protein [Streptomyces mesophilus]NGO77016.1 DUF4333 domain-containing protein [Streptomyces mesophilus]
MPAARLPAATWLLTATAAVIALAGCSVSVEAGSAAPELSAQKLAALVADKLAATTGQPKPAVACPEDLAGKVGTTTRCQLTASDGSSLGVAVRVTSVDGDQIKFDIKADETASPASN